MTLLFMDGFDHYATADIVRKWTSNTNMTVAAAGRFGGNCLRITGVAAASFVTKTFAANASWVIGFAFKTSLLQSGIPIIGLTDAGTAQCDIRLNLDGTLTVTRNGTALTGGTSVAALSTGVWYYIEWKVTIADSIAANSCQVRLNGTQIINVTTGQDTKNTANASATAVYIGKNVTASSSVTHDFDDLYVLDQSGSVNNNFLGDMRVEALFPTGAGATSAWTASAGSNYQCVDETAPNDDTDYVSSSTVGNVDTYATGNLSSGPTTIAGVQTCLLARKDDAGARSIAAVARPGSTDRVGATVALGTTYAYLLEIREQNPDTTAAWTESGVNGTEFGEKMVS